LVDPYRAIANNNRKRRFHRGKVIVAIRNGSKPQVHADERGFFSFYHLRSSATICGSFLYPLKIIVEHAGMTNQTHLFGQFQRRRSNQRTTPRTDNVIQGGFVLSTLLRINTCTQFDLPD
jgi:hypothetical protein